MEGTQSPTKMPASLLSGTPKPNHKATEKRNDTKAAAKINQSDLLNMIDSPFFDWYAHMDELTRGRESNQSNEFYQEENPSAGDGAP